MTESGQGPSTLHLVVPSRDGRDVLVQAASKPGRLRLPELEVARTDHDEWMAPVLAAVEGVVGRDAPMLRLAPIGRGWFQTTGDFYAETEALAVATPPPGLAWAAVIDLEPDAFLNKDVWPPLGRWLDEHRRGVVALKRPVWSQPGFVARASTWMRQELVMAGTPLLSEPRLTSLWGISAFLEGETSAGKVFFKSCAAVFATEPEITLGIDRTLPGVGPAVVAVEPEARWLLMRDVGGAPLGNEPLDRWSPGLAAFGRIQRAWVDAAARLPVDERVDLEDRSPARLAEILPGLVEDPGLASLAPADRERLVAELPRFVEACGRISELGPPAALVHGDFHPWNIHVQGDRFVIIDWSDGCLGHPFFDLPTFLGRTRDVAARRAMLDAYLEDWSEGYERARLEEAAMLGLALGSLHQVESYRRILATLDPEDEWDLPSGLPDYGRRALAWLDGGLEAIPWDDAWSS